MNITAIHGRSIYDSRGYPTVEAVVRLENGLFGRAAVPSGASTGKREAVELRDGGDAYDGKGVDRAVSHVNGEIAQTLIGQDVLDQLNIDTRMNELDGTENKGRLGANAILAVSLAAAQAAALSEQKPLFQHVADLAGTATLSLPLPMLNILNGGKHADSTTDIQEFMVIPIGASDFPSALRMGSEIFHHLGKILKESRYSTTVGDEGGYAPRLKRGADEALELIMKAIERASYKPGTEVAIALDVAASELVDASGYNFAREGEKYTSDGLLDLYADAVKKYPIVSIEDGLGEDDWAGWQKLTAQLGASLQLVGDDLLVTNPSILERAITDKAANAILIKPNQIGTLSETIQAVQMAQRAGWRTVMSHRSGETEDTTIAHLAVGLNTGQIKTGSFSRSERIAKYNELLRIYDSEKNLPLATPFAQR